MNAIDTRKVTGQLVPRCMQCREFHFGGCEDAAIEREAWKLIDLRLASALAAVHPRTLMADVPPALRGPRWQESR
ncbi:hypothetical protein [Streptomyces rubiginosohelvolus]|uniref:hypothetical protein n=1 Tax=Streptomyces rubiginosohelvolus TaxID=67362 RepID=UPI003710FAC9